MTTEAERIRIVNAALERETRRGTRDARAVMNATPSERGQACRVSGWPARAVPGAEGEDVSKWLTKRKKPYTERGIRRLKCFRCCAPAVHQWSICADGNNFRPVCLDCDIGLNLAALQFMRHPNPGALIAPYIERQRAAEKRP